MPPSPLLTAKQTLWIVAHGCRISFSLLYPPFCILAAENQEEGEEEDEDEDELGGIRLPSLGKLSVSEVTSNSVRLSWNVLTGNFDSFLVQYRDSENNLRDQPVEGDAREATVSGLIPSSRYRFALSGLFGQERLGPITVDASTGQQCFRT